MLGLVDVVGDNQAPIYKNLKAQLADTDIKTGFAKYLLNAQGQVVKFCGLDVEPNGMLIEIEQLINQREWSKEEVSVHFNNRGLAFYHMHSN